MVCEGDVVAQVIAASGGDLRKAITLLQSASYIRGKEAVTTQDILEIAGVCRKGCLHLLGQLLVAAVIMSEVARMCSDTRMCVHTHTHTHTPHTHHTQVVPVDAVEGLLSTCWSDSYIQLENKVQDLLLEGYSISQMLSQLHDVIVVMDTITDVQKSVITEQMGVR